MKFKLNFLFFSFLLYSLCGFSQVKSNLSKSITDKKIDSILEKNLAKFPNNTQVSIAILNGDKTQYIGVLRENDTLKVIDNKENIFEIGSITKVFNSVLFSNMVNEGKASVKETLKDNFDFTLKNGNDITLQQLANHTSGLPRLPSNMMPLLMVKPNNPYADYSTELLEKDLKNEVVLDAEPNSKYAYSNYGAGLLGYILTKKAGKDYETLLQEFIFNPLKMDRSSSDLKKIEKNLLIKGLDASGKEISNWDFTDVLVGAGGIKSNIANMEKFARKNFENNTIYNLPQQPTFSINDNFKIGLGWHISVKDNKETLWHNGATAGYRSCMVIDKERKKAIIILSNVSAFHSNSGNIDTICFNLLYMK